MSWGNWFLSRDAVLARYMLSYVHLSVCRQIITSVSLGMTNCPLMDGRGHGYVTHILNFGAPIITLQSVKLYRHFKFYMQIHTN